MAGIAPVAAFERRLVYRQGQVRHRAKTMISRPAASATTDSALVLAAMLVQDGVRSPEGCAERNGVTRSGGRPAGLGSGAAGGGERSDQQQRGDEIGGARQWGATRGVDAKGEGAREQGRADEARDAHQAR